MADLEKVFIGLEHCRQGPVGCQQECPYKSDFGCRSQLTADALELLKEQEPHELTKAEKETIEPYIIGYRASFEGATSWWYVCGNCNKPIDPNDKYCRHCGSAVKWDD